MKMKIALLTSAVVLFAATQANAALVLTNGGFEDPVAGPGGLIEITTGTTTGLWTAGGSVSTFILDEGFTGEAAFAGDQYGQINGSSGGGSISQFLGITDSLSNVTLAALFSPRTGAAAGVYTFGLYEDAAGTIPLDALTGQLPGTVGIWSPNSVTAEDVASGTSVYAVFVAENGPSRLTYIDSVTLTVAAVPEPSSLLFGLGVIGLGVVRRRR